MRSAVAVDGRPAPGDIRSRPSGWWGMILLLATEVTLFGVLIASYFYIRFKSPVWPPHGISDPEILKPGVYTGILVVTSLPMALAGRSARRGTRFWTSVDLLTALAVGALYLWLQAKLLEKSAGKFTPGGSTYGSLYFTLNGAHAIHVFAGLLLNGWVLGRLATGLTEYRVTAVRVIALYWHFVNALAVVVYLTIVSPSLP